MAGSNLSCRTCAGVRPASKSGRCLRIVASQVESMNCPSPPADERGLRALGSPALSTPIMASARSAMVRPLPDAPVIDHQIAAGITADGIGEQPQRLLRHDADLRHIRPEIAECVDRQARCERANASDVAFQATV